MAIDIERASDIVDATLSRQRLGNEVKASDPLILGAAATVVSGIALIATMIPAYRAARLDPARVLRPD